MKLFREYISEGVSDLARLAGSSKTVPFWFNPKTNKLIVVGISAPGGPWHATAVAKDPRKFGTTKEEILKYMEKWDREWHFYDDFGQTVESFYDEVANQVKDRSTGIQVLMGEKGFFKCTLMRNLVSGSLGDPTRRGSVQPTKAQWRDFVGMISLIPNITEINLNGFSAPGQYVPVFKADFEFFTKYGRVPQRTEVGSRMAQLREETDVLSEGSYPIGLLRADHKGWIHPEKKMFVLFAGSDAGRPYHEEHVVIKPEEYGLTKEFIEDFFGKDERMKSKLVGFRKGTLDTNKELAKEMFDRGWIRFSKYARNGTISMENRSSNDFNILHKGSLLIYPTVRWPEHEGTVPPINRIELYGKMSSIFIKSSESWEYWLKTKKEPRREEREFVGFSQWLKERLDKDTCAEHIK